MQRLLARTAALLISMVVILIVVFSRVRGQDKAQPGGEREASLVLIEQYPSPVITVKSAGAEGNKYGFEGGNVVKLDGTYHLMTTEMTGDPFSVKTKLAHWSSRDRIHWKRVATLVESSGEFEGKDPRASLWGPMFIYDSPSENWDLIYVAYRAEPDTATAYRANYEGTIWRAVSRMKGRGGIGGPYVDAGVLLRPDKDSQPWEGLQGTDSFFAYQVGNHWLGFYGSANTEHRPVEHWRVGLAESDQLAGPWKRRADTNPVNLDKRFAENPIVSRLDDGSYMAVYDNDHANAVGYSWSADGVHCMPGRDLVVQPKGKGYWADDVRTPLGLVAEGHGVFTLFYTGFQKTADAKAMGVGSIGFVRVKLER
jgi:hypothetical protein